jgi:heme A synthase
MRPFSFSKIRFPQFAWGVLIYMLGVILWGAVVRASGSGDGCGKHWPICGDHLVPVFARLATVIEYSHRVSTGLMLPLIGGLCFWAFRAFPRRHPARSGAFAAVFFTLTEAAFGAVLVKFGLVTGNQSVARVVMMSLHLLNTLMLLAALTLAAWWSAGTPVFTFRRQGVLGVALGAALGGALFVAASGAIAALADTLYPVASLRAALHQDLNPGIHYLIRLRLLHPIISITVAVYALLLSRHVARLRPSFDTQRFARYISILFVVEISAGFINVLLLAPMWMQLLHLLLADLLWITLVLLTASALAKQYPSGEKFSGENFDR